jgi:hypothetical protein
LTGLRVGNSSTQRAALLTLALSTFQVLGEWKSEPNQPRLWFSLVRHWLTPSFSPIQIMPGETISPGLLEVVERVHQQHRTRANPYVAQTPYFTVLRGSFNDQELQPVLRAGWARDSEPLALDIMIGGASAVLSPDLTHAEERLTGSRFDADYAALLKSSFGGGDDYVDLVKATFAEASAETSIVSLRRGNAMVAAGSVSVRRELALLSWGAVHPNFREQGLHKLLVAACRAAAVARGAKRTMLVTRNSRVRGRGDTTLELDIFRKLKG